MLGTQKLLWLAFRASEREAAQDLRARFEPRVPKALQPRRTLATVRDPCADDLPLFWDLVGMPSSTTLSELTEQRDHVDIWRAYAKLMKQLVKKGGLAEWKRALVPYHNITESVLMSVGGSKPSYTRIRLEDAKAVGPFFMDHLKRIVTGESEEAFEEVRDKLRPYQPLLEQIYRMVHAERWPDSDFSVGRFLVAVYLSHSPAGSIATGGIEARYFRGGFVTNYSDNLASFHSDAALFFDGRYGPPSMLAKKGGGFVFWGGGKGAGVRGELTAATR